jgi:TolB protein
MRAKALGIALVLYGAVSGCGDGEAHEVERDDSARQLTFSSSGASSQNPAFSPDGKYILFTRFLDGYNGVPSELVRVEIETGEEEVIVPTAGEVENTSVPGTSWVDGKICWSSDAAGASNEIYVANEDGSGAEQVTQHPESEGYYIEPVFDPTDTNKIVFEYGRSDDDPHQIAIVERDVGDRVTMLTAGAEFDDRLPNWSFDGTMVLFQRADAGEENWRIFVGAIDCSGAEPDLVDVVQMPQPDEANTDNSWFADSAHVLSSTYWESDMPNVFAYPLGGGAPTRITATSTNEDGAPSSSHDGQWIAFESHYGDDEEEPSDIWIIEAPADLLAGGD